MNAEIICIGTEILLGDIVNTNAQYLAKRLSELGINVYYQTVVGDNPGRIRVTSRGTDREDAHRKIDPVVEDIVSRIGKEYIDHISDHD